MVKRYPYWGWLLLAILFWSIASFRFYMHTQMAKPASMADLISCDLQQREEALNKTLQKPGLVQRMFGGVLSVEEVNELAEAPFYIYAVEKDTNEGNILIFWNSNVVVGICAEDSFRREDFSLFRNNGVYLKRCIRLPGMAAPQSIVVLYPIIKSYPLQNQYLESSFAAADYIPSSTKIFSKKANASIAVKDKDGHPLFYLQFKQQDLPKWIPDTLMLISIVIALLFSFTWIHLIAIALARKKLKWLGLLLIIGAVSFLLGLIYLAGLPFHLTEATIFSTQIYASSSLFPSLGVLLLDMFCLLWILVFLLTFYKEGDADGKTKPQLSTRVFLAIVYISILTTSAILPVYIIRNLVIDSKISFDVSNFYTVNIYTIIGLFAIGIIAGNAAAIIYWINEKFTKQLGKQHWIKYFLLLFIGILLYFFVKNNSVIQFYAYAWMLLFTTLLDLRIYIKDKGLFASEMIFWASFIALTATASVQYFNEVKEGYKRKLFAENVVRQRDDMMEFLFTDIGDSIRNNNSLKAFLYKPSQESRVIINENLVSAYLRSLNRYETEIYLFDKSGMPLFNKDTTSIHRFFETIDAAIPTGNNYLFFRENADDGHYYIASIPIRDRGNIIGYAFVDMTLKKAANATVYPELLQSAQLKMLQNNSNYTYAIYAGRELITQVSDHPFPVYRKRDTLHEGGVRIIKSDGYNVMMYKVDKQKTVSIIVPQSSLLDGITLFSYMLGILMVFGLIALCFHVFFYYILRSDKSEKLFHPTLRKRIHLAMLGLVFISFLIIGAVTIWVFVSRYNDSNKNRLRAAMKRIERSVQQELKDKKVNSDPFAFDAISDEPAFKKFISDLANSQSIDINIYNSLGTLNATSQDDIYNKLILARLMMPDAYYKLASQNRTLLIQNEHIGKLNYLSGYVPIRNEKSEALGYINVPYFSSQKEVNYQISNILVALINFYAIIFLISSFFALLITNWLTRGLQMIIGRFQRFNLKQNELLVWQHNDEIGLLVNAYNNMVKKVEESTSLLAQSERESAWREMARQVAHEIMNPLTPMKLNIQYLQNALQTNQPNARQLTENVAASLIEQIDNLSHIASAFSDFAKMPEAIPEEIILNELLYKAVELYLNNTRIQVVYEQANEIIKVYADKSQLLRVFTNLLQNAVEAIAEDTQGNIDVVLNKENDTALITIRDNGNGIPLDIIEKIFNPYFTTKGSGTGLGLAMTKKIIEFWKGDIWFETQQGKGTTFFIRLPLLKDDY